MEILAIHASRCALGVGLALGFCTLDDIWILGDTLYCILSTLSIVCTCFCTGFSEMDLSIVLYIGSVWLMNSFLVLYLVLCWSCTVGCWKHNRDCTVFYF